MLVNSNNDINNDYYSMFADADEENEIAKQSDSAGSNDSITLDYMLKLPDDYFYKHWDTVLACVEWVYKQAKNHNSSEMFAQARRADHNDDIYLKALSAVQSLVSTYLNQEGVSYQDSASTISQMVTFEILGLGIIDPIWSDPRVEEVYVDGPDNVNITLRGQLTRVPSARFANPEHVNMLVDKILQQANRKDLSFNTNNPYLDARLQDYSRVAALTTDVAPGGPIVDIRRHPQQYWTISDMVDNGTCNQQILMDIAKWIKSGMSMLCIGSTGSGKTTFLDAISGLFPNDKRIWTIEDVLELELNPNKPFKVPGTESRKGNSDGTGAFTMHDHVRASLRMNPGIVVIGETRDKTAYDLVDSANTGAQVFSTVHANNPEDTIVRLTNLISTSGMIQGKDTLGMIASAFDIIVHMEKMADGTRRVVEIAEVGSRPANVDGEMTVPVRTLWEYQLRKDENGRAFGDWVKVNEPSPLLQRTKRLDFIPDYTWDQCVQLEGFEGKSTKIVH
jgi:pilus assembly protein CpaF